MFKGKLTYASGVALAVQLMLQLVGVDLAPTEVDVVVAFVSLAANVYGRWRATRP